MALQNRSNGTELWRIAEGVSPYYLFGDEVPLNGTIFGKPLEIGKYTLLTTTKYQFHYWNNTVSPIIKYNRNVQFEVRNCGHKLPPNECGMCHTVPTYSCYASRCIGTGFLRFSMIYETNYTHDYALTIETPTGFNLTSGPSVGWQQDPVSLGVTESSYNQNDCTGMGYNNYRNIVFPRQDRAAKGRYKIVLQQQSLDCKRKTTTSKLSNPKVWHPFEINVFLNNKINATFVYSFSAPTKTTYYFDLR
jgi:hypothetical protein